MEREPVTVTIARALHRGGARYYRAKSGSPVPGAFDDPSVAQHLSPRDIYEVVEQLAARAPVLLLVDEFGKNLEAYSEATRAADPYLLQELAEWTHGPDGLPLVIITMQHLSFEEYVGESLGIQRREWVKVQGRFEDVPYVETAGQARAISSEQRLRSGMAPSTGSLPRFSATCRSTCIGWPS